MEGGKQLRKAILARDGAFSLGVNSSAVILERSRSGDAGRGGGAGCKTERMRPVVPARSTILLFCLLCVGLSGF